MNKVRIHFHLWQAHLSIREFQLCTSGKDKQQVVLQSKKSNNYNVVIFNLFLLLLLHEPLLSFYHAIPS